MIRELVRAYPERECCSLVVIPCAVRRSWSWGVDSGQRKRSCRPRGSRRSHRGRTMWPHSVPGQSPSSNGRVWRLDEITVEGSPPGQGSECIKGFSAGFGDIMAAVSEKAGKGAAGKETASRLPCFPQLELSPDQVCRTVSKRIFNRLRLLAMCFFRIP